MVPTIGSCLCACPGTSWLQQPCVETFGCATAQPNVVCFNALCLCIPGYYYSWTSDSCVAGTYGLMNVYINQTGSASHEGLRLLPEEVEVECLNQSNRFSGSITKDHGYFRRKWKLNV